MNINKIVAIALALVFTLSLFAGCGSSTPVKEKDAGEITIFVDSTMKGALTAAATAYTKPVREKPEREKAIILINSASTEDIVKKLEDGEYAEDEYAEGEYAEGEYSEGEYADEYADEK